MRLRYKVICMRLRYKVINSWFLGYSYLGSSKGYWIFFEIRIILSKCLLSI